MDIFWIEEGFRGNEVGLPLKAKGPKP